MQEEAIGIVWLDIWRGVWKDCSRNFLESMKMSLRRNPRNGGYGVSTGHLLQSQPAIYCSQANLTMGGLGCIQLSCWPRDLTEIPRQPTILLRKKGCSLPEDAKIPLLRTAPMQLIEHREVKLVPIWRPYIYLTLFGVEDTLQAPEREIWTPTQPQSH